LSFSGIADDNFDAVAETANAGTASELITASASQTVTASRSGNEWMVLLGACLK
jgi:hypothetical protein